VNTDAFYDYWAKWFAQPEAEKMRFLRSPGRGGYYPAGSEAPGYEAKADPKEYFHVRLAHCFGPDAILPKVVWEVFNACEEEASEWLWQHGFGESIDDHCRSHDMVLRVLHYPATPDGNVGQAHCDFDLLTVSVPGTCPGLEVWEGGCTKQEGHDCAVNWVKRETFEVHVGEMLTHYAKIPATPHRVRTPPNTERFKAVFFYLPPNDFELKPGFTAGDYLKGVLTKAGTAGIGAK
jgi:isopenicillin N synthase-like dioxygenase